MPGRPHTEHSARESHGFDASNRGAREVAEDFRLAMRNLAGAVTAVTVRDGREILGIAATSVTSLSMSPPSLVVSVRSDSSIMEALRAEGRFTVHLLNHDQKQVADAFAGRLGTEGRAGRVAWDKPAPQGDRIAGAAFHVDCLIHQLIPVFSHVLVVGEVLAVQAGASASPLVYFGGAYHTLAPLHM